MRAAASHIAISEDLALTLLERRELPAAVLDDLSKNGRVMKEWLVVAPRKADWLALATEAFDYANSKTAK